MNQLVSVRMALSASNRIVSSKWLRKQWEKFVSSENQFWRGGYNQCLIGIIGDNWHFCSACWHSCSSFRVKAEHQRHNSAQEKKRNYFSFSPFSLRIRKPSLHPSIPIDQNNIMCQSLAKEWHYHDGHEKASKVKTWLEE